MNYINLFEKVNAKEIIKIDSLNTGYSYCPGLRNLSCCQHINCDTIQVFYGCTRISLLDKHALTFLQNISNTKSTKFNIKEPSKLYLLVKSWNEEDDACYIALACNTNKGIEYVGTI